MKEYIKKTMKILMIFAILFLVAGAVSASENVTDDDASVSSSDAEIISAKATGSFTELQNIIDKAKKGDTINLDKNYAYANGDSKEGVLINKSISINGNGMVLDGKDTSRIFKIIEAYDENDNDDTGNGVVLIKNLAFINGKSENGGAIFVGSEYDPWGTISLNISDCEFKNNNAIDIPVKDDETPATGNGGAIYSTGNVDIRNSKFIQNNAAKEGGAIFTQEYITDYSKMNVLNSNFTNNKAERGGAICSPSLKVSNSNFIDNYASIYAGAIYSYGDWDCELDISKSLFKSNRGGVSAGAIRHYGIAKISESEFINNTAKSEGGAIFAENGQDMKLTVTKSSFINNSAKYGGAICFEEYCYSTKSSISDSIFKYNTATKNGGAIANIPDDLKLKNNTYIGNNKEQITIKSKNFKTSYNSGKVLKITVVGRLTNTPVKNVKVTLTLLHSMINGPVKKLTATTNSKGVASFKTISKIKPNYYTAYQDIEVVGYDGGYNYRISVNIPTITKAPSVTAKLKASKDFKVTVKNKMNKKAVKNCKVKVKVYTGKKYKTYKIKTDKKGVAKLNTKILKKGTHKVEVSSGNYKYTIDAKSTITIK